MTNEDKTKYVWPLAIIFIGVALRLYSYSHSYAINADGMLYINQAKSFHYGQYGSLTNCYPYLNILPILISFSYRLIGDWLLAAKVISLLFGTATLFPLYLLLKRFLSTPVALCTLLVFAVNPVFVEMCNEVIRGPICWFFLTLGMYLFTLPDFKKKHIYISISCVSFIIAGLARIEAIIFIPATMVYLLLFDHEKKLQKLAAFIAPLLIIAILAISSLSLLGFDLSQWLYPRSFSDKIIAAVNQYELVRQGLAKIASQQPLFWDKFFFPKVSNLLWWLGIGTVLMEIIRTFFEPFFLLFIFGLNGVIRRVKEDKVLLYLLLLSVVSFIMLNMHVQQYWIMRKRFVAIFLLPSFFLVGFGLENIFSYFSHKFNLTKTYIILFTGLLVFTIALPKNMSPNRERKKIFYDIGQQISSINKSNKPVKIVGGLDIGDMQLVNFFSNITIKNAPCAEKLKVHLSPSSFNPNTISKKTTTRENYLLWDEKNWTKPSLEKIQTNKNVAYTKIDEWHDSRIGRLILFQINSSL